MSTSSVDSEFIKSIIPSSKNKLQSVFEAISNSLEANCGNNVNISIVFYFRSLLDSRKELEKIDIIDNGSGFTDKDCDRFVAWGDRSKKKNNRGSGRMQFYHDFKKVVVNSIFRDGELVKKRTFTANSMDFIKHEEIKTEGIDASEQLQTIVSLQGYHGKDKNIHDLKIDEFVDSLRDNLLLRFYLELNSGKTIHINIEFKEDNKSENRSFSNDKVQKPDEEGELYVNYERIKYFNNQIEFEKSDEKRECIKWAHFRTENDSKKGSEIKICSKNIPVQDFLYAGLKKDCEASGRQYLTVFYGDVFDEAQNVNHSVDGFTFPKKKDFSNQLHLIHNGEDFLFFDTIDEEIKTKIPDIYKDVKEEKNKRVANAKEIAKEFGIDSRYAEKIDITTSDKKDKITEKLYKAQAEELAKYAIETKAIDEQLVSINPINKDYESTLCELMKKRLALTTEQDRAELSKYVIRRDIVTQLLHKILKEELSCQQYDGKRQYKEGIIHDLFFKRKTEAADLSDLWLLNEDFVYYHGCSDSPLSEIKTKNGERFFDANSLQEDERPLLNRRPDVYLFDEEETCVVIEFKNKNENLADNTPQVKKYCNIIANRGLIKIKKFFCYLIGEKLISKDLDTSFKETINGDISHSFEIASFDDKYRNPIASGQLELIKLSSLEKRSRNRNKIFAEKLRLYRD